MSVILDISISIITYTEIEYGLKLNQIRAEKIIPLWQNLLKEISIFPFQKEEALKTAELRSYLKNQPIGAYDILIAATALAHNVCS